MLICAAGPQVCTLTSACLNRSVLFIAHYRLDSGLCRCDYVKCVENKGIQFSSPPFNFRQLQVLNSVWWFVKVFL